jgi:hypothetical protein
MTWAEAAGPNLILDPGGTAKRRPVVRLVGVELGRAFAGTTWLPAWLDDGRDGVVERDEPG